MAGTAVVPKGFELDDDAGQPVPDSRLPSGGPEAWQVDSPPVVAELEGPSVPPGAEAEWGTWSDGRPKIRRADADGNYYDGTYDENGNWTMVAEISGTNEPLSLEEQEALPSPPEGFFYDEFGGLQPEDSPEDTAPEDEYNLPQIGTGGAAYRGATSGLMLGLDDEFKGGVAALANAAGRALGINDTDPNLSIADLYRHFRDKERDEKDAAWDQHPYAYGAGYLPGALLSAPVAGGRIAQGETALQTARGLATAGAREGGIAGFGNAEGGAMEQVGDTVQGAALGGVLAPAIAPVARAVIDPVVQRGARIVGNVRERIAGRAPQAADSGLEALATRSTQDPAAMEAARREMVASGVDPRLIDVINEEGRGVVRNAANKMTPAREDLRQHAEGVYADMQDRVARQARENISQAPGTARQLGHDIAEEQRLMGPQFDAVRNEPVALTPEIIQAFSTADARSALRRIGRMMTAPEQAQLNQFIASVNAAARQIDPRLPAPIRQQIERRLFEQSPLTVDIADKFSRVLTKAAEDQPALMRVAQDYANTVRGAARQQYPAYDKALTEMAGRAAVGDAAAGTGRFGNNTSEFLGSPSDEYARSVRGASSEPKAGSGPVRTPRGSIQIDQQFGDDMAARYFPEGGGPDDGVGLIIQMSPDGQTATISVAMDDTGGLDMAAQNTLGPAAVRDAALALRQQFPSLRVVEGERITGARAGSGTVQRMDLDAVAGGRPTISEADALRMRARDDVVDRATAGSGAAAPGVARQLSRGSAQAERSRALLGDEGAERLSRGMGAELRRYQNTEYIDPGRGSKTASVVGDDQDLAGGVADAAANAASGGKWAAVRSVSNYLRNAGIRNVDAERLVRDAINPRRTRDAIDYLVRRGMERDRARSLVRSITANAGGRMGGALSYDGPPDGPGRARSSVRSLGAAAGRIDNVQGEDQ